MSDQKKSVSINNISVPGESVFDRLERLMTFPAVYPLKIMGVRVDDFADQVVACVRAHISDFDPAAIEMRASSKGTYLSVTLSLNVQSRAQLEAVYNAVSAHPLVKVVL